MAASKTTAASLALTVLLAASETFAATGTPAAGTAAGTPLQNTPRNAGTLTCTAVAPFTSETLLSCIFEPTSKGVTEYYGGKIDDSDLSTSDKTVVVWTVWTAGSLAPGGLEGTFAPAREAAPKTRNILVGGEISLELLTAVPTLDADRAAAKLTLSRARPRALVPFTRKLAFLQH